MADVWTYRLNTGRRLYQRTPGGNIYLLVMADGRRTRTSLGHADRMRAIAAHEDATASRSVVAPPQHPLTWIELVQRYQASPRYAKAKTKREIARALQRALERFGPHTAVVNALPDDWEMWRIDRNSAGVRDGTVQHELAYVRLVLRWAVGQRLLPSNPMAGYQLPVEKNPRRPLIAHDTLERLLRAPAAASLHRALIFAHETGRRLGAILQLKWSDLDLGRRRITWAPEHDKKGFGSVTPMSAALHTYLVTLGPQDPTAPVFYSKITGGVIRGDAMTRMLRRHAEANDIEWPRGAGFHTLRRKFATDRKEASTKDVMALGGWRSTVALLNAYTHEDDATMRDALDHPTVRQIGAESPHIATIGHTPRRAIKRK